MGRNFRAGASQMPEFPYPKDPAEKLQYGFDWTAYLLPLADTVSLSTWNGGGLTVTSPVIETGNLKTTAWLSGGQSGMDYTVANTVTTAGGRIIKRSFILKVADR